MSIGADPAAGDSQAGPGLLGRERELAGLAGMLDRAVAERGSAVLLRGEAGIGKTALLAEARRLAAQRGLQVLTCSGARSETHVPFAGLHQLLRPVLSAMAGMPAGQADLLRAALGLDPGLVADLYRVALATLELLATVAAKAPLLVVADDAHWLDRPSADVLAFVSRRVSAEPIAIMCSLRDGAADPFEAAGLPSLPVGALDPGSARALVDRVSPHLARGARERLLDDAAGNPLALVELPAALRSAGPLPERLPVGDLLRRSFTARVAELPDPAVMLLAVAAADSGCSLAELGEAASAAGRPVASPTGLSGNCTRPGGSARRTARTACPSSPRRNCRSPSSPPGGCRTGRSASSCSCPTARWAHTSTTCSRSSGSPRAPSSPRPSGRRDGRSTSTTHPSSSQVQAGCDLRVRSRYG